MSARLAYLDYFVALTLTAMVFNPGVSKRETAVECYASIDAPPFGWGDFIAAVTDRVAQMNPVAQYLTAVA